MLSDSIAVTYPYHTSPRRQSADKRVSGAGGEGAWGVTAHGSTGSFRDDGNVLQGDRGDGCTVLGIYRKPVACAH